MRHRRHEKPPRWSRPYVAPGRREMRGTRPTECARSHPTGRRGWASVRALGHGWRMSRDESCFIPPQPLLLVLDQTGSVVGDVSIESWTVSIAHFLHCTLIVGSERPSCSHQLPRRCDASAQVRQVRDVGRGGRGGCLLTCGPFDRRIGQRVECHTQGVR